jgi:formate hydrogenlyase transcriptional activator
MTYSKDQILPIIDQIPALAWSCLPDGTAEYFNQRWLEYTGLSMGVALGWGWKAAIHPDDLGKLMEKWLGLLASGVPDELEARLRHFDGTYRWFLLRAVPVRDEQGKLIRWYGTNTDIEDLKRSEEKLRQAEGDLRVIINTIPTMAWSALPDGSVDFLNNRWIEFYGLSLEQAKSWGWASLVHPEDQAGIVEKWRSAVATGQPYEHEVRARTADGSYRWTLSRAVPVRNHEGEIVRWFGTTNDIEDHKRAESLLSAEKLSLEMIAGGASLTDILANLCTLMDAQAPGAISSILLMDPDGKRLWPAAGQVPKAYAEAIAPVAIGPCVGSCGTAAFLKKRVIVSDIASDPLWDVFRGVALRHGLGAAWSQPLISKNGDVLGTFCLYYAEARSPNESDLRLIEAAGNIAVIAIERKRGEEDLRRSERELRQIVDTVVQLVVFLSPDGRALDANRYTLEYTGLSLEDVRAESFRDRVFHPEDVERLREDRRKALLSGVPFENEQRARRKDGQYRWFFIRYNALLDEQGHPIRWYAAGIDIDDRKRAEERMRSENVALREEIDRSSMFEEIVGSSVALRNVLSQVAKVARSDSTVLILGETGTGKELIARAIHKRSNRSTKAFIRVNCAAIPPSLIASELFGHEKGAFTGALQRRAGRFESADGGTIFLDEVGDLPVEAQVALLRVLQEREFERVGSSRPIPVDVRVVAATNRDLAAAVVAGTFRQDLFYRLNVFPIQIPPLRARAEDIPLLVEYLVERYGEKAGKKIRNISKKTLELFQDYDWPGNIRELQNVIERAVVLSEGETFAVDETWLKRDSRLASGPTVPFVSALVEREKEMIEAALVECHGRIAGPIGAAAKLGIPRQTLESKIAKLGINRHHFKTA